ncbi:MAG: hypothetical protein ACK4NR_03460 [Micavibrio sp.]
MSENKAPDNLGLESDNIAAPAMAAGFASVAQASTETVEESAGKAEARKSLARQLSEFCSEKLKAMKDGATTRFVAKGSVDDFENPYKKFWFSTALGPGGSGVADRGDCISMAGTRKRPVTDAQLAVMVKAALEKKSPPWETIYMFNHRGKPDLVMAQRVQNVINQMGVGHRISACVDPSRYPSSASGFDRMLRDMFSNAANGQQDQRPGFKAAQRQRPGFTAAQQPA